MADESAQTRLIRRISDGIIGWVVSERAEGRSPDLEATICDRIKRIALGREWQVEREFRHGSRRIDFAFLRERVGRPHGRAALLEVKFVSPRTDRTGDIVADIKKLHEINPAAFLQSPSFKNFNGAKEVQLRRYLMLLGKIDQVRNVLWALDSSKTTVKKARKLWRKVFETNGILKGAKDAADLETSAGWIRFSPAFLNVDEAVIVLRRKSHWAEFDDN